MLFKEHRKLHRFFKRTARVARHQVRYKVLLLAALFRGCVEPLFKLLVNLDMRLSHQVEYLIAGMLRSYLELTADMILHQLVQEVVVLVLEHVIVADSRMNIFFTFLMERRRRSSLI